MNPGPDTDTDADARSAFDAALPPVGLGTMELDTAERATAVTEALEAGYRHVDTAQIYRNEHLVGDAVAAADVPREEVLVATKAWADSLASAALGPSVEASRARLGVEAIDLLYVHRPVESYDPDETLPALDELREAGLIRRVGVSNFEPEQLDEARERLDAPLFAHQTELHPLYRRPDLVEYARRHGHWLVAYSPLAGGNVFDVPELRRIAEKHGTTPAAVSIAWLTSLENVVVVPKASGLDHLRANLAAADLELDAEDVAAIESIDREEELYPE